MDPQDLVALENLGWDPGWATAFAPFDGTGRQPARVVAAHRDSWVIATTTGDRDVSVSGRMRHLAIGPGDLPTVGDWVAAESSVIHAVLPRRSAFQRGGGDGTRTGSAHVVDEQVMAANIDVALLVSGLDGDFNERRLERYLAVAWSGGATPVVVLNKADVADAAGQLDVFLSTAAAVAPGVEVRAISARTGDGVEALEAAHLRPGRTAVVLGSSGVGKSTLVNALIGAEHMRTNDVRAADSRGRHTTTHRELIRLPGGGLLVDTPGIRSIDVTGAAAGLGAAFAELDELAPGCRFRDCRHNREPGCAVREALADGRLSRDRLDRHRKLEKEAAHVARSADRLLAEAERRKWKAISQASNRHMAAKYGIDR
jgi:ribosome biogenesis GTPase